MRLATSRMGRYIWRRYAANTSRSPGLRVPENTRCAPIQSVRPVPTATRISTPRCMAASIRPARTPAERTARLSSAKRRPSSASPVKALTTAICAMASPAREAMAPSRRRCLRAASRISRV